MTDACIAEPIDELLKQRYQSHYELGRQRASVIIQDIEYKVKLLKQGENLKQDQDLTRFNNQMRRELYSYFIHYEELHYDELDEIQRKEYEGIMDVLGSKHKTYKMAKPIPT